MVRKRLLAIRAEEHAEWLGKRYAQKESVAADAKQRQAARDAAQGPTDDALVIPSALALGSAADMPTVSPRLEARAVSKELDFGKLIVFRFKTNRYLYDVLDPADLTRLLHSGSSAKRPTLKRQYDDWRRSFSHETESSEWNRGLEKVQKRQRERYLEALTLLEVRHPSLPPSLPHLPLRRATRTQAKPPLVARPSHRHTNGLFGRASLRRLSIRRTA